MKKRILSLALVLVMALTILPASALAAPTFSDVPATHWAYDYVEYCAGVGIINGIGDGLFAPGETVSQAMFVTLLGRTAFRDWAGAAAAPGDDWYDSYWRAAEAHGLLSGTYVGYELAAERITRYDMAQLIRNTCVTVFGFDDPRGTSIDQFKDFLLMPEHYTGGVAFCYELGIINGYDNGTFSGSEPMTRDQAATVIYRLIGLLGDRVDFTAPGTNDEPVDETFQALADATEQYRCIIEMAGRYDFGEYVEPSGKYNYALVKMQPNNPIPALLLEMETTEYMAYTRAFQYDPNTKTVIAPTETLMQGVASAGGYRGGFSMAGDGNGILSSEISSGTGRSWIFRTTLSGNSLKTVEEWAGWFTDPAPDNLTFVDIDWYDSGDLSGLYGLASG